MGGDAVARLEVVLAVVADLRVAGVAAAEPAVPLLARGSTSSACAGRGSRRRCRRCGGAARPRARGRSRPPRTARASVDAASSASVTDAPIRRPPSSAAISAEAGVAEVDEERRRRGSRGRPGRRGRCRRPSGPRRRRRGARAPRRASPAARSRSRERLEHAGRRQRQRRGAAAGRVRERVRDRGGRRDDRRLAEALRADVRKVLVRQVDEVDDDLGRVGDRRHLVVVEMPVDGRPGGRVDDELLARARSRSPGGRRPRPGSRRRAG